jgi:hypothetical protein
VKISPLHFSDQTKREISEDGLLLDIYFVSLDILVATLACFVTLARFSTSEIRNFLRNLRKALI